MTSDKDRWELEKKDEYVKGMIYAEKAFADWIKRLFEKYTALDLIERPAIIVKELREKEKELRSNPLPEQSVDGKE